MKIIYKHIPKTAGLSIKEVLPEDALFLGHDFYNMNYKHLFYHTRYLKEKFVFSCVRNPYDRALSAFLYLDSGGNNILDRFDKRRYIERYRGDFEKFVNNAFPDVLRQIHFMPQYTWIYYQDLKICDYVAKFENLHQTLSFVLKTQELPHNNKTKHRKWQKYYTPKTAAIIYQHYQMDFELFRYPEHF